MSKAPSKPKKVKAKWEPDGYYLTWKAPKANIGMTKHTVM